MDTSWIISSVVAGILSACGVLMVIILACIAIRPRQVSQIEMRVTRENDLRVERADMEAQEEEEHQIDVTAGVLAWVRPVNCVASVNPDGSVAVARELVVENKSAV